MLDPSRRRKNASLRIRFVAVRTASFSRASSASARAICRRNTARRRTRRARRRTFPWRSRSRRRTRVTRFPRRRVRRNPRCVPRRRERWRGRRRPRGAGRRPGSVAWRRRGRNARRGSGARGEGLVAAAAAEVDDDGVGFASEEGRDEEEDVEELVALPRAAVRGDGAAGGVRDVELGGDGGAVAQASRVLHPRGGDVRRLARRARGGRVVGGGGILGTADERRGLAEYRGGARARREPARARLDESRGARVGSRQRRATPPKLAHRAPRCATGRHARRDHEPRVMMTCGCRRAARSNARTIVARSRSPTVRSSSPGAVISRRRRHVRSRLVVF